MSSVTEARIHKREQLAWLVLLGSFTLFLSIAIATPLLIRAYLQNSTRPLLLLAQSNQGTVSIDNVNSPPRAALPGEAGQAVSQRETVLTDATASGLLLVFAAEGGDVLARLQLYGSTAVYINAATTPRFRLSDRPQELTVELLNGRLRIVVTEEKERPLLLTINTPHGTAVLRQPGEYSFLVQPQATQVTVQEGSAEVRGQNRLLTLEAMQRAEIAADSPPVGPLSPERNLLQNGSFNELWARWTRLSWNVERIEQPAGDIEIAEILGENGLQVVRNGEGHADVGVRQVIDQDVTDVESLLLEIDFRIVSQSLGVCGMVGSECPLILRIEYDDQNGNPQVWQQGFYAVGAITPDGPPDVCVSCPPPRFTHVQAPLGQLFFYRADLIAELQRMGFGAPRRIKNISIIASGHSFAVEVLDITLLASEGAVNGSQ